MTMYQRIFVVENVARLHVLFADTIEEARLTDLYRQRAGLPPATAATQRALLRAFEDFNAGLRRVAQQGALTAQKAMRDRLDAYIHATGRGPTGRRPNLKTRTTARALAPIAGVETGAVGVAPEEVLNRAVNPDTPGYGTYWRAIEEGTGGKGGVPSQKGRVIRGVFTDRGYGDQTRPLAEFQQGGPHPIFLPASAGGYSGIGKRGGRGGYGTIKREIRPAHFIRNGANEALIEWRREIAQLELRTMAAIGGAVLRP